MAGELMNDGKYIYINSPYAEMYIPEDIIDTPTGDPKPSSVAYEYGNGFVTMGICYMRFFKRPEDSREDVPVKTLIYPNLIETHPTDSSKGVALMINGKADRYRILKYEHGDVLMEATSRKSSQNCEAFMRLLSSGKSSPYKCLYSRIAFLLCSAPINPYKNRKRCSPNGLHRILYPNYLSQLWLKQKGFF